LYICDIQYLLLKVDQFIISEMKKI